MDKITGIRELDAYLILFFDQNTIYNYSILLKQTNQIATNHSLFGLLKEYYQKYAANKTILAWATSDNKPLILDWHMNIGYKFENTFFFVNSAIKCSNIQILDWFYQKGIFDYTLASLRYATLNGFVDVIDWFYDHNLEIPYLDTLLSEPLSIVKNNYNSYDYRKILKIFKWAYRKKYPIRKIIEQGQIPKIVSEDFMELIKWLLEHQLINKSIFSNEQSILSFHFYKIPTTKQLEILTWMKELGYHFKGFEDVLSSNPVEVLDWYIKNIPHANPMNIFRLAALSNKVSIVERLGINKNHPSFNLINHNFILRKLLSHNYIDMIIWYSKNIMFDDNFLSSLFESLDKLDNLPIDIIILLFQYLERIHWPYESVYRRILQVAFVDGNIPLLEYLITKCTVGSVINIYIKDIARHAKYGRINILRWLEKYLNDPKQKLIQIIDNYGNFESVIDRAASYGYLEAIKWVKQFFPHKFKYERAIDYAAISVHIDILDWFDEMFGNTPEFKYSCEAIDGTDHNDRIEALKWFHYSGHPLNYSAESINNSIRTNLMRLEWFKRHKYPMTFTLKSIYIACEIHNCEALQWLKNNGVIKMVAGENRTDLRIFTLELSQPFANSSKMDDNYMNRGQYYFDVEYVGRDKKIIEIRYKRDKLEELLTNSENREINALAHGFFGVYNSLCWFERCLKLAKK